jgi:hypothetical protein
MLKKKIQGTKKKIQTYCRKKIISLLINIPNKIQNNFIEKEANYQIIKMSKL